METPVIEPCGEGSLESGTDPRWSLVCRIADSPSFQKSHRLREFLLYVSKRTLENRADEVREQTVGHFVFGRRPDYNPNEDNIVRVEARHLRKRLDTYFAAEGAAEPLVITIPKGTYVPRFETRALPNTPAFTPAAAEQPPPPPVPARRKRVLLPMVLAGATALLLFAAGLFAGRFWPHAPPGSAGASSTALWSSLFNDEAQTFIVCADSSWVLRQDILDRKLSLADYIGTNWNAPLLESPGARSNPVLRVLKLKQYTSMADVRLVERLAVMNAAHWRRTDVRSSRFIQLHEFKNSNVVLIGSSRSTPWAEMFDPELNFAVEFNYRLHIPVVRNKHPKPGEQASYQNGEEGGKPSYVYSTVSYLPNLNRTGHILLIQGSSSEGTEAAGEWVTSPASLENLLFKAGLNPAAAPNHLEVLLQSSTMEGTSGSTRVVAYRSSEPSREASHSTLN